MAESYVSQGLTLAAHLMSLEQAWATLDRVPSGPLEPRALELVPIESSDIIGIAHTLFAPAAVSASHVSTRLIPRGFRVGDSCNIRLMISEDPAAAPRCVKGWADAVATVTAHTRVVASLARADAAVGGLDVLVASCTPSENAREVKVTLALPASAACGDTVIVERIEIAGDPIRSDLPVRVPICNVIGLCAPLAISVIGGRPYDDMAFALTETGTFFAARSVDSTSTRVHTFSPEGIGLCEPITVALRFQALAVDSVGSALYTSLKNDATTGSHSPVVALDPASGAIIWRSGTLLGNCYSVAAMSRAGVIVAGSCNDSTVHIMRASDGASLASANAKRPHFVAADEANSLVFSASAGSEVHVFRWTGTTLELVQVLQAPGHSGSRALAVVPPSHGKGVAHLVVGSYNGVHLCVFSLPDLSLVFETDVEVMYSLAADAAGTSIVLCHGDTLRVLAWPLPGMPLLH